MEVPVHIALGLGLIAEPRRPSVLSQHSPLRFAADLGGRLGLAAFLLFSLWFFVRWWDVLVNQADPGDTPAIATLVFPPIVALLGFALVARVVDPLDWARWLLHAVPAAIRRAGAYWEDPDSVEGPDDVFARLMDRPPGPLLGDVEGFVAFARRPDWPLRWARVAAWCRAERRRLDDALAERVEQVVVGGERLHLADASSRIAWIEQRLREGHRVDGLVPHRGAR